MIFILVQVINDNTNTNYHNINNSITTATNDE